VSWEPLCADQPVEGEPVTVGSYGSGLVATGELIAEQVIVLRRLAEPGEWQAETADAFRDQASDLAAEITKVEGRFREVGGFVTQWAEAIEQTRRAAGRLRDQAQTQQVILERNPEVGPEPLDPGAPVGAVPTVSGAGEMQNARRQAALDEIEDLRGQLEVLISGHGEDGERTGELIRGALNDGLNDGWRDRLKAWIADQVDMLREIAKWAGRIAAVIGLIALFISPLGWVAFAAAVVAVVASGLLAASGDGTWFEFGLNVVGALTFGLGAFLTRGATAAFRGGRALLATRASVSARAAILNAADGPLVSLASRIPVLGGAVRGVQSTSRAVRAPIAGAFQYVTTRFAPLATPSVGQFFAFNGRRLAAIRNEALVWVDGADDIAAFGNTILRTGWFSGTRFVPYVSIPGVAANGYSLLLDRVPALPRPTTK